MLTIKCEIKGGFRRCGVRHPGGSTEYPDGTFTAKQIAGMKSEKRLVVEIAAVGDPYEAMTKADLLEKIAEFQSIEDLPKLKKAELVECLKGHETEGGD